MKKLYVAGNSLRKYFEGEFESIDEAWSYLSRRFLMSYPSQYGRTIYMSVMEKNQYGIEALTPCKGGITEQNRITIKDASERCRESAYIL